MTDDEMHNAISIAREHWFAISGQTLVWLIPDAVEEPDQAQRLLQLTQGRIVEHGEYRFVYIPEKDELYIGRIDEDV